MSNFEEFSKNIKGIRKTDPDYYLSIDDDDGFFTDNFDPKDKTIFKVHEGIIFLVEVTNTLLSPYESTDGSAATPPIVDILDSLNATIEQLTITLPNTGIGLYIFNTSEPDADSTMKEIFPIRDINVQDMRFVNDLIDDVSSNRVDLFKEWCPLTSSNETNSSNLISVLSEIKFKFRKENLIQSHIYNKKKVFLFTDNDDPQNVDAARCRLTLNDLKQNEIEFNPFLISAGKKIFDSSKFYEDIAKKLVHGDIIDVESIKTNLLKEKVLRSKEIERKVFFCPLQLSQSVSIGVTGYLTFQNEKPASRSRMYHAVEKTDAKSKRQYLLEETGEDVTGKVTQCYELPNKKQVKVEDSGEFQVKKDPKDMDAFLKVVGFANDEHIFSYFTNIDKPYFVVPDETELIGSRKAFTSLYKSMFKQKKCCLLVGKVKKAGSLQNYLLTVYGAKETGLFLYKLPSKEEIRLFPALNEDVLNNFEDDQDLNADYQSMRLLTSGILDRITMKKTYKPSDYKNPHVQKYYKVLKDYLLQVEVDEDILDDNSKNVDIDDTLVGLKRTINAINKDSEFQENLQEWLEIQNKHSKLIDDNMVLSNTSKNKKKAKK